MKNNFFQNVKINKNGVYKYFMEFIILFLAVAGGFYSDYRLDQFLSNKKEKEIVRNIINDLESDSISFQNELESLNYRIRGIDSLLVVLNQKTALLNQRDIGFFICLYILDNNVIIPQNNRTISILKYSEGYYLMSNLKISKKIDSYYNYFARNLDKARDITFDSYSSLNENTVNLISLSSCSNLINFINTSMNYPKRNMINLPCLLKTDKETIEIYYNKVLQYKQNIQNEENWVNTLLSYSIYLKSEIKNEYEIEYEIE